MKVLYYISNLNWEMADAARGSSFDSKADSPEKMMIFPVVNKSLHPSGTWSSKVYKRNLVKKAKSSLAQVIFFHQINDSTFPWLFKLLKHPFSLQPFNSFSWAPFFKNSIRIIAILNQSKSPLQNKVIEPYRLGKAK